MRLRTLAIVSAAVSVLTALAFGPTAFSQPAPTGEAAPPAKSQERTVRVSAQSVVHVSPDEVVISLEVATRDKDLTTAKTDNDKRTQAILALGKKYRLADNAVKIDTFTIQRQYDRSEQVFIGYRVNRQIEFVLSDFNEFDSLISSALAAGATSLDNILLRTTKHLEHQWEARRKAVEIAKEKAGHLASLNGLVLGKAIEIEEGVEGDDHTGGMGGMGGFMANKESDKVKIRFASMANEKESGKAANASKPQTTVALGQISVRATVNITFELIAPK